MRLNASDTLIVLGLIFITLKLTGHLAWSWWWVLAPFWIPPVFIAAMFAMVLSVFLIIVIIQAIRSLLKKD